MKRQWQLWAGILSAVLLTSAISIFGQQKPGTERNVVFTRERVVQGPDDPQGPPPPPGDTFVFVTSEMNFEGKLVKGAPYSAQAVTEVTQTLSDGNRIVNKSNASVYRDSEGRTRREYTLKAIAPFGNGGDPLQSISINDPVTGVNYALDPRAHIAHKMAPMRFEFKMMQPPAGEGPHVAPPDEVPASGSQRAERVERVEAEQQVFMRTAPGPLGASGSAGMVMEWHGTREGKGKTESLGKQTIEGVEAEGTRNTVTIPAGEIGNERAIEMVSERWYSPELQVVVMTRHSDPRFGQTIYRLTNINRSEPARSLFEVPADYTIQEGPPGPAMQKMRLRKPSEEQ